MQPVNSLLSAAMGSLKSRPETVIHSANKTLFLPRVLKAEIGKLDALAHIARTPVGFEW